jgi:hypothetical protein
MRATNPARRRERWRDTAEIEFLKKKMEETEGAVTATQDALSDVREAVSTLMLTSMSPAALDHLKLLYKRDGEPNDHFLYHQGTI